MKISLKKIMAMLKMPGTPKPRMSRQEVKRHLTLRVMYRRLQNSHQAVQGPLLYNPSFTLDELEKLSGIPVYELEWIEQGIAHKAAIAPVYLFKYGMSDN